MDNNVGGSWWMPFLSGKGRSYGSPLLGEWRALARSRFPALAPGEDKFGNDVTLEVTPGHERLGDSASVAGRVCVEKTGSSCRGH